jgi:NDP-4-keto-2,6-dideoxyhexose 3-C-methyltransferase
MRLPDFIPPGNPLPPAYPLELMLCEMCGLLQLKDVTPRSQLYHDRYGFKSGINEAIRADLADVAKSALEFVPGPQKWLDIACNDGTLLASVPPGVSRFGIDPLAQFAAEASSHGVIISDYFRPGYFRPGQFDVVTSVSMFYDLADPREFTVGVRSVLARDGIWVIQMNYSLEMLRNFAVDNVGHEHVTYYGVSPLQELLHSEGMDIVRVTYSPVNGGCFRAFVSHRGRFTAERSVSEAVHTEHDVMIGRVRTWERWLGEVERELNKTRVLLEHIRDNGQRCLLYGASTRIGTVLQMIDVHSGLIQAAVERNPDKVGRVMGATGIPVISEEQMRANPPEYLLIGPYFFRDVFAEREKEYLKSGGKMIFPLPRFEVMQ